MSKQCAYCEREASAIIDHSAGPREPACEHHAKRFDTSHGCVVQIKDLAEVPSV